MHRDILYKGILVSDFNLSNFASYLRNNTEDPPVEVSTTPFGQMMPILLDENADFWKNSPDFAVVWTQPEIAIPSFKDILDFRLVAEKKILEEVKEFATLISDISKKVRFVFVPTWTTYSYRCFNLLNMKPATGISNILMKINLQLLDSLEKNSNIYVLDAQVWVNNAGKNAFNPKLWYMAKIPFGNDVFIEAAVAIKSALRGLTGNSKKLVIVDLDDTLWGGIVGDVGWENLKLGGHDPIGEAFTDFQRALKSLTHRGILLGIVSKNEEKIVIEAFNKHPEMILKLEDFAGWKINWGDKAQNVVDLVSELNLGLQSVVFIDDNPVERERIRQELPEVIVPEWPEDKTLYKRTLLNLPWFNIPSVSQEDSNRTKLYVNERQRKELLTKVRSLDGWLQSLEIKVKVEDLNLSNLSRTAQLFNKTNQMNLSTRRLSESELWAWGNEKGHKLWTFRVSDKFGDSGITGIISLEWAGDSGQIIDFILSCRVMGRKVEETMLYVAIQYAQTLGLREIKAKYIPTSKNLPCLSFFKTSGFTNVEEYVFIWPGEKYFPKPMYITII